MPNLPLLSKEDWQRANLSRVGARKYAAMYSSWVGGIVTDVDLMMVPIDDHLVHRGDGIFEALAFLGDNYFAFNEHIERLYRSADIIGLKIGVEPAELKDICKQVVRASALPRGYLRIFVSRGPGDFSPNPYTTLGAQLYVVAVVDPGRNNAIYENGASLIFSKVPLKPFPYAQVKSCNYLQNVMTKKEAVDRNADFAVNLTEDGFVAEGPTENLLVFTSKRELIAPPFDYTLRGTTLMKVFDVAATLKDELRIESFGQRPLSVKDVESSLEVMMVGTTLGACPVTRVEGNPVADGKVGTIARRLDKEIQKLMGR